MNGTARGDVGIETLTDELRVAYLEPPEFPDALHMAQLEWVSWTASVCENDDGLNLVTWN